MRKGAESFGLIFFMIAMIIFASGAIVVYTVFIQPENMTKVPVFTERSIVDAVAEAENLGLVVQVEQVASTLTEGRVLAQSPESGTELRKGKVVVLQVAKGGDLHPVPNVAGKSLSEAQAEIKAQGFALGDVVRIRENGQKAGNVIAQSPAAPASIGAGRKIDLLVQDAGDANGNVIVPDVNRMTEKEARSVLEAGGVKVQGIDRVYSPLLPEGLAIETRPAAGSSIKAGQGVMLKLATQRRPAGFMDAESKNVRRVNSGKTDDSKQDDKKAAAPASQKTPAKAQTPAEAIKQTTQAAATQSQTAAKTQAQTQTQNQTAPAKTQTQTQAKTQTQAEAPAQTQTSSGGNKTAKIHYVVPPIARPMNLRVELTDPSGKRNVLNRQVRTGEVINSTAKYSGECVITMYLGGEFVWQERQK